ncbi:MAG: MarR family transcriptional regulator [Polyangiaceae bacterium]
MARGASTQPRWCWPRSTPGRACASRWRPRSCRWGSRPSSTSCRSWVAAGHTTPRAVAAASGRDKTTLSRTIARAARAGFLEPARRDDDRRRHDLLLTSTGQAALEHSRRTLERTAPKLLETLSAKQQRRLGKALRKMGG